MPKTEVACGWLLRMIEVARQSIIVYKLAGLEKWERMSPSEIINNAVLDLAHELPAPLQLLVVHLLLLLLLRGLQLRLVDAVLLQHDGLHVIRRGLGLLLGHLLLALLLLALADLLALLQQPLLAIVLRLGLGLLSGLGLCLLGDRSRHGYRHDWLFFDFLFDLFLRLLQFWRFLDFLSSPHWRKDHWGVLQLRRLFGWEFLVVGRNCLYF